MDAQAVAAGTSSRAVVTAKITGGTVDYIGKWIVSIENREWADGELEPTHSVDCGMFDTKDEAERHRRAVVMILETIICGVLAREHRLWEA